jgi:tripartite-type tricarboxylate transporter receptor subunit TctC
VSNEQQTAERSRRVRRTPGSRTSATTWLLRLLTAGSLTVCCTPVGWAQSWPARPIRLVATTAAGGGTDLIARTYSNRLAAALGQPVVIDNRPSAGGVLALETVARSGSEGYTLLASAGGNIAVSPLLYKRVADLVDDLVAIAPTGRTRMLLVVNPGVPATTVGEFVGHARANPGKLSFGSPGVGTLPHLAAEMMLHDAKLEATHVPFKDSGQTLLVSLMRGDIQFVFDSGVAIPQIKAGKLKLLAIAGPSRSPVFPNAPTMAEAGYDVDGSIPQGVYGPASTSRDIVARLHGEISRIMQTADVRKELDVIGAEPVVTQSPEEFQAQLRKARSRFGAVVRAANVRVE